MPHGTEYYHKGNERPLLPLHQQYRQRSSAISSERRNNHLKDFCHGRIAKRQKKALPGAVLSDRHQSNPNYLPHRGQRNNHQHFSPVRMNPKRSTSSIQKRIMSRQKFQIHTTANIGSRVDHHNFRAANSTIQQRDIHKRSFKDIFSDTASASAARAQKQTKGGHDRSQLKQRQDGPLSRKTTHQRIPTRSPRKESPPTPIVKCQQQNLETPQPLCSDITSPFSLKTCSSWTKEEVELLVHLQTQTICCNDWDSISKNPLLKHKTLSQIKTKWYDCVIQMERNRAKNNSHPNNQELEKLLPSTMVFSWTLQDDDILWKQWEQQSNRVSKKEKLEHIISNHFQTYSQSEILQRVCFLKKQHATEEVKKDEKLELKPSKILTNTPLLNSPVDISKSIQEPNIWEIGSGGVVSI